MLVHFPIVFWSCAVVADATSFCLPDSCAPGSVAGIAFGALALGCITGLLAMAYGAWLGGKLVYEHAVGTKKSGDTRST